MNINGLINLNYNLFYDSEWKYLFRNFFFVKKRDTIKRLLQFISRTKLRRDTHTCRCRVSSGGFQRKLVHGNASSSWISRLLSRRNNSLYLCHPPILPTLLFSTPSLSLSLSYLHPFFRLSFRIFIIPVALFSFFFSLPPLHPCKHIERTRPEEEIIAFWHRGIASISRYCSRRSRLLHFITAKLRYCCKSASFEKRLDIARE